MSLFTQAAALIFCTFMILMILVTITAYGRRSGSTGLDMAKVHHLRVGENHQIAEAP
jgi:hypothetical protein